LGTAPALGQQTAPYPQQGFYVGGAIGQSTFWDVDDVEFDLLAFMFSGIVGYRLNDTLRTEGELLYESAEIDGSSADLEVTRFLGSAFYDFAPVSLMGARGARPYLGAGGGLANVDGGDDDIELTFHGEVGVSAPLGPQLNLVPGVRLSYTTLDGGGDDLWVTQLRVGLRYSF
jgi:hypothetical protein